MTIKFSYGLNQAIEPKVVQMGWDVEVSLTMEYSYAL
jgi:hypothetical protein